MVICVSGGFFLGCLEEPSLTGEDDPPKTRVAFQVRVRFAACYPRKSYLICSLGLPRRFNSPRFVKIEEYTRQFIGHEFRITSEADLDREVQSWIREAYRVGEQQGLTK